MSQTINACVDRQFYEQAIPGTSFEEARAILVGMYVERQLEAERQQRLKAHLDQCDCCTQFLTELEKIAEFKVSPDPIPYASCPSSEQLDIWIFDRAALDEHNANAIGRHLEECPLCQEEVDWLTRLEHGKVIEYREGQRPAAFLRKTMTPQVAAVAAVFFFTLSALIWWQIARSSIPTAQLRALAHVKQPNEINFASLEQTAVPLDDAAEQMYQQGVNLFKQGDFRDAGARFEKVLEKKPDHSASLFLLGYCYYKLDEMDKAFALCNRAERMRPYSYERCMSLVHMALMTGHYDRAIEEISAMYHHSPNEPEINRMYHEIMRLTRGRMVKM